MPWLRRGGWDGLSGRPRSSNGASSQHLFWLVDPAVGPWTWAEATLEVLEAPAVAALYFWALQVSFTGGGGRGGDRGPGGREGGAGHVGLQWHPEHPGSTAVNWGGYDAAGRELDGSRSALPSALANANTRDFAWSPGVPYRIRVRRPRPGEVGAGLPPDPPAGRVAWRAEVTDTRSGTTTVVRDLWAEGTTLANPMVWSEVFARCDDPPVRVRWSGLRLGNDIGEVLQVDRVRVNYQAKADGGCATGDVAPDALGVVQTSAAPRRTQAGQILAVPQPETS